MYHTLRRSVKKQTRDDERVHIIQYHILEVQMMMQWDRVTRLYGVRFVILAPNIPLLSQRRHQLTNDLTGIRYVIE
jgi:hypothetical protein